MQTLEVSCDVRIEDGKGIVCHGLEFSLAILRESLQKFEARHSCEHSGLPIWKTVEAQAQSEKPGVQLEVQTDCGSRKRKCGATCQQMAVFILTSEHFRDNKSPHGIAMYSCSLLHFVLDPLLQSFGSSKILGLISCLYLRGLPILAQDENQNPADNHVHNRGKGCLAWVACCSLQESYRSD